MILWIMIYSCRWRWGNVRKEQNLVTCTEKPVLQATESESSAEKLITQEGKNKSWAKTEKE